jgi:translation elongation factor EF-G
MNSVGAPREPLRHYAEVHVRLVPGERGSGIRFESLCHVDDLALQWQRLVETHVFEKHHRGVLVGAPLTDVTVQLLIGRAHLKHTEGSDFREATYRAIRCALRNAESVLLEPWCSFSLRAPADLYGRITGDLTRMRARCAPPSYVRDVVILTGEVSFREISGYPTALTALAHGRGMLSYRLSHYEPARDAERIAADSGYDVDRDDPADSVFCQKGAGFNVNWHDVPLYAHCPQVYQIRNP